ncbi:MAG: hypothetical protein HY816_01970 [Candidatus Wallbacteria bacterium]|nr:hypothetical protein [Candidatus Wallbacteria bacterium]
MSALRAFGALAALGLANACLAATPELAALGQAPWVAAAMFLAAAVTFMPRGLEPSAFRGAAALGLAVAFSTPLGRELAPEALWAAVLILAGWIMTAAETPEESYDAARPDPKGLASAISSCGAGLLVASLGFRLGDSCSAALAPAAGAVAAALASLAGEPWCASAPWIFPPGSAARLGEVPLGLAEASSALAVFAFLAHRLDRARPRMAVGAMAVILFLPVRAIAWSWFFSDGQPAGPATFHRYAGLWQAVSALPLVALLALCLRGATPRPARKGADLAPPRSPQGRKSLATGAAVIAAGALASWMLAPEATVTAPLAAPVRLVLDETHSDWEPVVLRYDDRTGEPVRQNNYVSMARFLSRLVALEVWLDPSPEPSRPVRELDPSLEGHVAVKRVRLDDGSLDALTRGAERPVLLLKCPTIPYSERELEAVVAFVERGGGLLLFGEHSDAFFLNTHLNPVAGRFGIRFRADEHYDAFGGWIETDRSCHTPGSPMAPLGPFMWATNCTIELQAPAVPLVLGRRSTFAEPGNYFVPSFFGNRRVDAVDRFGDAVMMACSRFGKGRVIAFTDSTSFNNAYWSYPDRRLLWYLWLRWLSGQDSSGGPWDLQAAQAAALGAAIAANPYGVAARAVAQLAVGAGLGWGVAGGTSREPVDVSYLNAVDPAQVVFDVSHGASHAIGEEEPTPRPPGLGFYGPALEEVASLGINARVTRDGADRSATRGQARLAVIVSPRRPFEADEVTRWRRFVEEGGRLLLIAGPGNTSAVRTLAAPLGLEFSLVPAALTQTRGWPAPSAVHPAAGGPASTLWTVDGTPVLAGAPAGKGYVAGLGDDLLAAATTEGPPGPAALALFRGLIRALLSEAPQPAAVALAPAATALGAAKAPPPPPSDVQSATSARLRAALGRLTAWPAAPLPRLAALQAVRRTLASTGPFTLSTWPLAAGPGRRARIVLACGSSARERLERQAGRPLQLLASEARLASPPAGVSDEVVLAVHPSALLATSGPLAAGIEKFLSDVQDSGLPPDRVALLKPETIDESLAATLLAALMALGPADVGRWYEEAAGLEQARRRLSSGEHGEALRLLGLSLARTSLPDAHLALMAVAAASAGRHREASLWLAQARPLGTLAAPLAHEVARFAP